MSRIKNKSIKIDETPYFERFRINLDEIDNETIYECDFSVRTENCLLREGIKSIPELLRYSGDQLLNLGNFGVKCLKEVEEKIELLKENYPEKYGTNCKYRVPRRFIQHIDKLTLGDFSFLNNMEINEHEVKFLNRYREEVKLIDEQIRIAAKDGNEFVVSISDMLETYSKQIDQRIKYRRDFEDFLKPLNHFRLNQYVKPYLKNYGNKKIYSAVKMNFSNMKVKDINVYLNLVLNYDIKKREIDDFLNWSTFNIEKDFGEFLNSNLKSDREEFIIRNRSNGKTLEFIGVKLGVSRERVRQIEKKIVDKSVKWLKKYRLIDKVFALNNNIKLITLDEIVDSNFIYKSEIIYILSKYLDSLSFYEYLDENKIIISKNDFNLHIFYEILSLLPEYFDWEEMNTILKHTNKEQRYIDAVKKYIEISYKKSGRVYHKKELTFTSIYIRTMTKYFGDGLKVFDNEEMKKFRSKIHEEYGNIDLPENDRSIGIRISENGILCDRGTYKIDRNIELDEGLKTEIYNYILESNRNIILTRSVFKTFRKKLLNSDINNHYFLHGVLKKFFSNDFYFNKDCIMKSMNENSISDEIIRYIKEFDYPLDKDNIREEFPGATGVIISRAISQSKIVNLFGRYIDISMIGLNDSMIDFIEENIKYIISDYKVHHADDLYYKINNIKPNFWKQIYVEHPYSAFSIAEILFSQKYQFNRPFFSQKSVKIRNKEEILKLEFGNKEKINVKKMHEVSKKYKLNFPSIYSLLEIFLKTHYMIDKKNLIKVGEINLSIKDINDIEKLVIPYVKSEGTMLIRFLPCIPNMPEIGYKWNEWLIFSIIKKHSSKLEVELTSNYYQKAYPLVSFKNKIDRNKYYEIQLNNEDDLVHDMDNIDELLDEIIEVEI